MDVIVKEAAKLPQPTNKVLLRPHQMVQHEQDITQCEADLANAGVKMKGIVRQRKKALEKQYLEQAPQPITDGALRDKVAKRINDLEEQIKVGLPTAEEMRKATNITVEQHRKWERLNKPRSKSGGTSFASSILTPATLIPMTVPWVTLSACGPCQPRTASVPMASSPARCPMAQSRKRTGMLSLRSHRILPLSRRSVSMKRPSRSSVN